MPPADLPLMRSRFTRLIHWMKPGLEKLARPRSQQKLLVEMLEDRLVMNTAWGGNGPPLSVNTNSISAVSVALTNGDAGGSASITTKNEVDYFKFTTSASGAGFYRLSATGGFDAMVGIYAQGSSGKLLGYADSTWSGAEQVTVYLEASKTYYLGVTNYLTSRPVGNYTWSIDDIDPSPGNPGVPNDQRILYVNFDGATLAASNLQAWDNDWQYGSAAEFDPNGDGVTILPFLAGNSTREQIISNVLNYVQQDLAGFGVRVVRLAAGSSAVAGAGATTVFVGPSTLEDKAASDPSRGLFHVASDIDVGNNNATDIAFVYDENWGTVAKTSLAIADVVLHEAGHTFGLFHVNSGSAFETMGLRYSNANQNYWVNNTSYMNQSFYLREFYGSQDSYQEVANAFGVRSNSDVTIPGDVTIASLRREERLLFHPNGVADGPADHDEDHDHDHLIGRLKSGTTASENALPTSAPVNLSFSQPVATGVRMELIRAAALDQRLESGPGARTIFRAGALDQFGTAFIVNPTTSRLTAGHSVPVAAEILAVAANDRLEAHHAEARPEARESALLPSRPPVAAVAPYLVQEAPWDVGTPAAVEADAVALPAEPAGSLVGAALLLTGTYLVASERERRRQPRLA